MQLDIAFFCYVVVLRCKKKRCQSETGIAESILTRLHRGIFFDVFAKPTLDAAS